MNKKNDLNKIRKQIDDIDIKILSLLNKRAGLARKTTALKKDIVFDPKREKEIFSKLRSSSSKFLAWRCIYKTSKNWERECTKPYFSIWWSFLKWRYRFLLQNSENFSKFGGCANPPPHPVVATSLFKSSRPWRKKIESYLNCTNNFCIKSVYDFELLISHLTSFFSTKLNWTIQWPCKIADFLIKTKT